MAESATTEVTVWTDALRAQPAAAVLERMGDRVRPIGVGGPRVQAVSELATALGCPRRDDLRQLVVDLPARFLLLTSMEAVEPADLLAAAAQGTTVLALELPALNLQELATVRGESAGSKRGGGTGAGRIVMGPAFGQCPGFLSAAEPFEAIGDRRVVAHESVGASGHGSLVSRLFDAWRTVLRFTETPVSVDAALVGGSPPDVTPEELRELSGALTAHGRMPDGSAAVLHVADRAGQTRRSLHVLGDAGELRVSDGGYALWQLDGKLLDQHEPGATVDYPELVAHQWRRLLDRPGGASEVGPMVESQALACCLACVLSARTAQPESPGRVLQMNR